MLKSGKDIARVAKSPAEGFRAIEKIAAGEEGLSMETEDIPWIETLSTRFEANGPLGFLSSGWRRVMQRLPYYNHSPESGKKLGALATMSVARRMANPDARPDMLQKLLDARDDVGNPLSPTELAAEAMVLIIAGSDTIAKYVVVALDHVTYSRVYASVQRALYHSTSRATQIYKRSYKTSWTQSSRLLTQTLSRTTPSRTFRTSMQ